MESSLFISTVYNFVFLQFDSPPNFNRSVVITYCWQIETWRTIKLEEEKILYSTYTQRGLLNRYSFNPMHLLPTYLCRPYIANRVDILVIFTADGN